MRAIGWTVCLATALTALGCQSDPQIEDFWTPKRALGKGHPIFKPPRIQLGHATPSDGVPDLVDPTGTLTLSQAMALAMLHNPELRSFSWEMRIAEARIFQAAEGPTPEIQLRINNFGGTHDAKRFEEYQTRLRIVHDIELGGKRARRIEVAELNRQLVAWDFETKRLEVLTDVAKSYINLLAAVERLAIDVEAARIAKEVHDKAKKLIEAGVVEKVVLPRLLVRWSEEKTKVARSESRVRLAKRELAATWGSTVAKFEKVEGRLENLAKPPSFETLQASMDQNPELARMTTEVARRQAQVRLAQANAVPDVELGFGVRHTPSNGDTSLEVNFSVPLDFFAKDRNKGDILEARYDLARAKQLRLRAELRLSRNLGNAHAEMVVSGKELEELEVTIKAAAEAYDAASLGLKEGAGVANYRDILDAEEVWVDAKRRRVDRLESLNKAAADIQGLIGGPIKNDAPKNGASKGDKPGISGGEKAGVGPLKPEGK